MEVSTNEVTEKEAAFILSSLPSPRRNTYLKIAQKNAKTSSLVNVLAARLYLWNGYLAAVVDRTTGEIEVLLRNFMNESFAEWNSAPPRNGSSEWLTSPKGILADLVTPEDGQPLYESAHISTVQGTPVHDDYIAGLTFGNWVHLLPKAHAGANNTRVTLWNEALQPKVQRLNQVAFQKHTKQAKDMRNRATHRRPLIREIRSVEKTHQSCIEVAKAINPPLGEWLRDERWIPNALQKSPLKNL